MKAKINIGAKYTTNAWPVLKSKEARTAMTCNTNTQNMIIELIMAPNQSKPKIVVAYCSTDPNKPGITAKDNVDSNPRLLPRL